ncbi:MAG: type II toxin-antitoxin system HicA family toxin [Nitrosarchaeum sp.]
MSKLPRPSTKDLAKFLNTIGYRLDHTGKHHVFKNNERKMVTVPERKELGRGLLLEILSQVGSSRDDFIRWWNG